MIDNKEKLLKNNHIWAQLLITVFVLLIISYLLSSVIFYSLYSLLDNQTIGFGYDASTTALESFLIQIEPVLAISTIILFLIWFYRVYENLHILQPIKMNFSKKWAIGCWFIPVINFHRPYEIMKEIWLKTQELAGVSISNLRPRLIGLWWVFFLLRFLIPWISQPLMQDANNVEDAKTLYFALICGKSVDIIAAFLAIAVVLKTNQLEKRMLQNVVERDIYDHLVEN